jgi:hypothetical protein
MRGLPVRGEGVMQQQPEPGNLRGWTIYWQQRAASLAADAREWRTRDVIIADAYQETACTYYARARHLLFKLLERY